MFVYLCIYLLVSVCFHLVSFRPYGSSLSVNTCTSISAGTSIVYISTLYTSVHVCLSTFMCVFRVYECFLLSICTPVLYVFMYEQTCVCMVVCIHLRTQACARVCLFVCLSVLLNTCIPIHISVSKLCIVQFVY